MKNDALQQLIEGYHEFRKKYVGEDYTAYRTLASKTQIPRIMVIACSDSRINPAIITHAGLGEIFMVNNVANLVPVYKPRKNTYHSTSAALEYAIIHLEVEHIIILGHSYCGGIKALMEGTADNRSYSFIATWVEIANEAKELTIQKYPNCNSEEQCRHCEKESLLVSLKNLATFPWLKAALDAGKLAVHAWYFDIKTGELEHYIQEDKIFASLLDFKKRT
jgi:carbonic anhydrase